LEFHKIGGSYQSSIFLAVLIISVPFKPRQKKRRRTIMTKTRIIRYVLIVFLFLPLITFAETKEIKEYKVIKGDTLWDISKKELNDPFMWPRIWKENSWIANPHWIYPDQMIKIPLYLNQEEKRAAEVTPKSTEETTLKSTEESQASAVVSEQQYKGIMGIVLYDGTVIEGQIIFMSADIVKIRTKDGNTSSYSFIKEVQSFIKE
jgi:hypothetical protein